VGGGGKLAKERQKNLLVGNDIVTIRPNFNFCVGNTPEWGEPGRKLDNQEDGRGGIRRLGLSRRKRQEGRDCLGQLQALAQTLGEIARGKGLVGGVGKDLQKNVRKEGKGGGRGGARLQKKKRKLILGGRKTLKRFLTVMPKGA